MTPEEILRKLVGTRPVIDRGGNSYCSLCRAEMPLPGHTQECPWLLAVDYLSRIDDPTHLEELDEHGPVM
jgi:hypothetical protein